MEKINTEKIVSSLLVYGFDKVDSLLYTLVLGKLVIDNRENKLFKFEDEDLSLFFRIYVNYDDTVYSLRNDYTLDSRVETMMEGYYCPLRSILKTSENLLNYFDKIDFNEIVMKKILCIGSEKLEELDFLFSSKEKEMIYKMSSIEQGENKINNIVGDRKVLTKIKKIGRMN